MTNLGKSIRIERLFDRKSKRTIIIPMDHGLTLGTIKGLENLVEMIENWTVACHLRHNLSRK